MSACCSSGARPAYKQRVDLIFTTTPSTNATAPLAASPDVSAVTKLLYYANVNSDKLPRIAAYLEQRIHAALHKKKHLALAVCGAYALNELLKSCHRDVRLFYASVASTIKELLAFHASRDITLIGVELFITFASLPSRVVVPPPSDADAFLDEFVRLASEPLDAAPSNQVLQESRVAGLRGLRAYLPLLDEQLSRLSADAPRILPVVFDNMRFVGPAVAVRRNPLSPDHGKDDDDLPLTKKAALRGDGGDRARSNADDATSTTTDDHNNNNNDDDDDDADDDAPTLRGLARQCLRELAMRTLTTDIKSFVESALAYVDANSLWTGDGAAFPVELFKSICGTLKPHDYQTALDCLLAKATVVHELPQKTRVVHTLRGCIRDGMLTVHQLVRTLLQQLIESLQTSFATKSAEKHTLHAELHASLLGCIAAIGRVVDQSKRVDLLDGIVRQLKSAPAVFAKATQRAAVNALLVKAFASVAVRLKQLTAADTPHIDAAYEALLAVAAAPATGAERVACALGVIESLRALVSAAPPRTDDDDDRAGTRFMGTGDIDANGAKKRTAIVNSRGRRNSGGARELAVHVAAPYVEHHARIVSALDRLLFPAIDTEAPALCSLVAAAGSLLLTALAVYGVAEALRTLPYVFLLQQRATDMRDVSEKPPTKTKRSAAAAAAGIEAAVSLSDPTALHVLVGAYMAALVEQLDNDELRATVAHTLALRTKKKQRSAWVVADASPRFLLTFKATVPKKELATAKRITATFERSGIVSVLQRDRTLQSFGQLASRLSREWEQAGEPGLPASVAASPAQLSRMPSVAIGPSSRSTSQPAAIGAAESAGDLLNNAPSARCATYPHNAPEERAPPGKALAAAGIDAARFLAILRGDKACDDDAATVGGDEHSDGDGDGSMQVSDSAAISDISVDDDANGDDDDNDDYETRKHGKKKAKAKKATLPANGVATTDVRRKSTAAAGTDEWRDYVSKLRERSFDEVAAESARAHATATREIAAAAFHFDFADSEQVADYEDDDITEPAAHHNWHMATTLPNLLTKLDGAVDATERLPRLRDEFAVGTFVL